MSVVDVAEQQGQPAAPPEAPQPNNGASVVPDMGAVQDRETFADLLLSRVANVQSEQADREVIWRWTHVDRNHLALFVALAKRYGLRVFRVAGTRGHTVFVQGPRNIIWDLKRYAWEPLTEVIRLAVESYFEGVVAAESGVDLDLEVFETLEEVTEKIKPSRVETEH